MDLKDFTKEEIIQGVSKYFTYNKHELVKKILFMRLDIYEIKRRDAMQKSIAELRKYSQMASNYSNVKISDIPLTDFEKLNIYLSKSESYRKESYKYEKLYEKTINDLDLIRGVMPQ